MSKGVSNNNSAILIQDWSDTAHLCKLMDTYGDNQDSFFGMNGKGELITISIGPDSIALTTYQNNNRVRSNWYYRDGTSEEVWNSN